MRDIFTNHTEYIAPDIDVVMVEVEGGFQNSLEDPWESDDMDW